ncbi:amidophosphoribosyltransferase [Colletotrichum higginsianum]|nr:amidophosphoribosyltransferase [Colletotrichum higginsianum]
MCGVSAILLADSKATTAAIDLHESLYLLQHRGQDAAGIAVCQGGRVYHYKGNGMAAKVFADGSSLQHLPGFMALLRKLPFGISIAVNGNLVNTEYLRQFVDKEALRHVNSDSDSELLLNIFAHGLQKLGKTRAVSDDIFTALGDVYSKCQGAFACTAMIAGFGILGFRQRRQRNPPLCIGSRPSTTVPGGKDYFMASESVALKQLGFGDITDVLPGQAILITKGGSVEVRQIVEPKSYTPDSFEFVYLARPDSTIDGISVYRSRQMMGEKLAKKIREVLGDKGIDEIDAIIPVPETSNTAAAALAQKLGKPYVTALIKNRYVHRTFILPNQAMRQKSIRRKLSPIESEFEGKNLIIVDDSLVRGNLIARGKTRQEIAEHIDADDVIFLDLEGPDGLKAACLEAADSGSQVRDFEVGVFCGRYVTDVPDGYFDQLSDLRKGKRDDNFRSTVVASDSGAAIFV